MEERAKLKWEAERGFYKIGRRWSFWWRIDTVFLIVHPCSLRDSFRFSCAVTKKVRYGVRSTYRGPNGMEWNVEE